MKKNALPLFAAAVTAAGLTSASAVQITPALVNITADGLSWTVPATPVDSGKGYVVDFEIETDGFTISLDATLNPDPSIAYGIAVTDIGAPSIFTFAFFTPIVPTGSPNLVDASISGAFTDFTGNGVSATATAATIQGSGVGIPLTSMGVDVGPSFSAGPGSAGALYTYGAYTAGPIAGPAGVWTTLAVTNSFTLSGDNDIAVFTGFAQIVEDTSTVPEGGAALAGLGTILGLFSLKRFARGKA